MVKLRRTSTTICFYGGKGTGKTQAITYFAFKRFLQGYNIYSNYNLKFGYIPLQNIQQIKYAHNGIMLLDDLEQWLSSRRWKTKESQEIMEIILQGGKRNIYNLMYSVKRPENIDLLLRDTTDYWVKVSLVPNFTTNNIQEYEELSKDNKNLLIKLDVINDNMENVNTQYIGNLEFYSSLYNTQEEIKKMDDHINEEIKDKI